MPTGYTHKVQDGEITSLRDFAMVCARAFGALILMRDSPMDAPIPERFEPSNFYTESMKKEQEKLAWLRSLAAEQKSREAVEYYRKELESYHERLERIRLERSRYENMLKQVEAWQAPDEVEGLKEYMIEQLKSSIDFDCNESYVKEPEKSTGDEWYIRELKSVLHSIEIDARGQKVEIERTEERNRWLAALRASLPEGETK